MAQQDGQVIVELAPGETVVVGKPSPVVEVEVPSGMRGATGETGPPGPALEFTWDGTELGVRVEGTTEYTYVDLIGPKGDKGDKGDQGEQGFSFEYTWDGTELGVRVEGEAEYTFVDLIGHPGVVVSETEPPQDTILWVDLTGGPSVSEIAGIKKVLHGTDGDVPRPKNVEVVYWIGAAVPANAEPFDFWYGGGGA